MQLRNSYFFFTAALDSETCNKIVSMGNKRFEEMEEEGKSTFATTFGGNAKGDILEDGSPAPAEARPSDKTIEDIKESTGLEGEDIEKEFYVRDTEVCWFNDQWMYDLVYPYLHEANRRAGWRWQFDNSESFQFTRYTPGGFYGWHADGNSDHLGKYKRFLPGITPQPKSDRFPSGYSDDPKVIGKIRKLSMTINLNIPGEYEGGNLKFDFGPHTTGKRYHECEEIRPQGSIIIFPSFIYHQVTPLTKGTRYSLVLWTLGDPWV